MNSQMYGTQIHWEGVTGLTGRDRVSTGGAARNGARR